MRVEVDDYYKPSIGKTIKGYSYTKKGKRKRPKSAYDPKYLGTRVKDAPPKGLSSVREVEDISDAIVRDYKRGKISKKTASGRLALLENPIVDKAPHLKGKRRASNQAVRKRREYLKTI